MDFSENYNNLCKQVDNLQEKTDDELLALWFAADHVENEYNNMNLVVKCDANSLYGTSASEYFSKNDFDLAEDITTGGKFFCVTVDHTINGIFVKWDTPENLERVRKFYPNATKIRNYIEYVPDSENDLCPYGDTDSRYVDLETILSLIYDADGNPMLLPASNKELADFGIFIYEEFLVDAIRDALDKVCEDRGYNKGYLRFCLETISRKTIFQAKKKYILANIWKDGKYFDKPKLVFKGVELKRGSTTPRMKKIIAKLMDEFLINELSVPLLRKKCLDIIAHIRSIKQKDTVYLITKVSGLRDIKFDKSIGQYTHTANHLSMQVALSWMNFIHENNLTKEYQKPFEGQKMNFYYTVNSKYKLIGIPDDVDINSVKGLPDVDWGMMVRKSFVKPLLRYIFDESKITDMHVETFLLGIEKLKI